MIQSDNLTVEQLNDVAESTKGAFDTLKGLSFDDAISQIANSIVNFSFKLLIAILVFYVGRYLIRKLYQIVNRIMLSRKVDPSLTTFVLSLIKMLLYFILIVTIIGILGLETSSFLAIFASAGVAIGMALSGTLQNFAGGVLILLLKPYKVGDFIEASGFSGTVKAIQIFHTIINTPDNKTIIIPNGGLSTGSINNYSSENYRRVDWKVALSYDTDYPSAVEAIKEILLSDSRVVIKYIADDIAKRDAEIATSGNADKNLSDNSDNSSSDNDDSSGTSNSENSILTSNDRDSGEPKSFLGRLFESRKHKSLRLQQQLRMTVGLDNIKVTNADCSPFVGLNEMADSSINLTVRAWTHSSNYWPLYFEMNEKFFIELPKRGFSFPFPQLDIHVQNN